MFQSSFVPYSEGFFPLEISKTNFLWRILLPSISLGQLSGHLPFRHHCPLSPARTRSSPPECPKASHSGTRSPAGHSVAGTEIPSKCLSPKLPVEASQNVAQDEWYWTVTNFSQRIRSPNLCWHWWGRSSLSRGLCKSWHTQCDLLPCHRRCQLLKIWRSRAPAGRHDG